MKFKILLVSEDNRLNLSNFGVTDSDCEIIDINKTLNDVVDDEEVKTSIKSQIISKDKIYIVCVKEDFGSNVQDLNNIPNIKVVYKKLKKEYKKFLNLYFFVYNTYLKSETAISPKLESTKPNLATLVNEKQDQLEKEKLEKKAKQEESKPMGATFEMPLEEPSIPKTSETPLPTPIQETKDETLPQVSTKEEPKVQKKEEEEAHSETEIESEKQEEQKVEPKYLTDIQPDEIKVGDKPASHDPTLFQEPEQEYLRSDLLGQPVAKTEVKETKESSELDDIYEKEFQDFSTDKDVVYKAAIVKSLKESQPVFDEKKLGVDEKQQEAIAFADVEKVAVEKTTPESTHETTSKDTEEQYLYPNKKDVDIPESFYDVENEAAIGYEDYHEFSEEYELNIHALKSIYDFIWRILVLNNNNLRLNDLLYIAVNNLDAFSVGQSNFVREMTNRAESLFDLILQLDVKLEFNNSLFYIYLAEFFTITNNKIYVSNKFLETLSIWINASAKQRFVEQIEQYINYSTTYNKKIIFAYFIEYANYVKGNLPTINSKLSLIDIHRILLASAKKFRKDNIFNIICQKINNIFVENEVVIELYFVKTPENMFGFDQKDKLPSDSDSWKYQLAKLYSRLVENIYNFIMLKGNNEDEIFNIYIDIKDLKLYKSLDQTKNALSSKVYETLNEDPSKYTTYYTIGDNLLRSDKLMKSQQETNKAVEAEYLAMLKDKAKQPLVSQLTENQTPTMDLNYPTLSEKTPPQESLTTKQEPVLVEQQMKTLSQKYMSRFSIAEFEESMAKRISDYEKKIRDNITRIETERKLLKSKIEQLKNS